MARYRLKVLGCKTSRADAEAFERGLISAGLSPAGEGEAADIAVVCGCAVTSAAEAKSRKALRRLARENPGAMVVAAGCLGARAAASEGGGADVMIPPALMSSALEALGLSGGPRISSGSDDARKSRTRGILKVQDGCDCGCAYCIVPSLRGGMRSVPPARVLAEVERMLGEGRSEIVLSGIRLGAYSSGGLTLAALVRRIADLEGRGLLRLRLSSIEPMDFSGRNAELVDLAAEGGPVCPHFHLPLQSADDEVLARMGRPYSMADYRWIVERIRGRIPDVAITTDMIAGFPGEGGEAHRRSVMAIREIGFARVHAFQFSPREGTRAASMSDHVDERLAGERTVELLREGEASARSYRAAFVGRRVRVIAEAGGKGYTERYVRVRLNGGPPRGRPVEIDVTGDDGSALVGEVAK